MAKNVLIVLVALVALGWFLQYIASGGGGPGSDTVRTEFVAELEQFDDFAEHRSLLSGVVDRVHAANYEQALRDRGFDREAYRAEMYRALIGALSDTGEAKVATRLEQFRSTVSQSVSARMGP